MSTKYDDSRAVDIVFTDGRRYEGIASEVEIEVDEQPPVDIAGMFKVGPTEKHVIFTVTIDDSDLADRLIFEDLRRRRAEIDRQLSEIEKER